MGNRGRSRLTFDPDFSAPRFVRSSVSGDRPAENEWSWIAVAVRQTPLTAMLPPPLRSDKTVLAPTFKAAPCAWRVNSSTVPVSSMIPVNMTFRAARVSKRSTAENATLREPNANQPQPKRGSVAAGG